MPRLSLWPPAMRGRGRGKGRGKVSQAKLEGSENEGSNASPSGSADEEPQMKLPKTISRSKADSESDAADDDVASVAASHKEHSAAEEEEEQPQVNSGPALEAASPKRWKAFSVASGTGQNVERIAVVKNVFIVCVRYERLLFCNAVV